MIFQDPPCNVETNTLVMLHHTKLRTIPMHYGQPHTVRRTLTHQIGRICETIPCSSWWLSPGCPIQSCFLCSVKANCLKVELTSPVSFCVSKRSNFCVQPDVHKNNTRHDSDGKLIVIFGLLSSLLAPVPSREASNESTVLISQCPLALSE